MYKLAIISLGLLSGCAGPPVIQTQVVDRPVPVFCEVATPAECKSAYAVGRASSKDDPLTINRALRAEIEERWACEIKLLAAVKGSNTRAVKVRMINWEAIQAEYGIKSNRALASEYGCAESSIRKQADKEKWKKPKVRTEIEVRTVTNPVGNPTKKTPELMETIFEAIANGKSTRAVCAEIGISTTTFFR